jgi:catechol 2,3-dioxygenase-like lactoylglutathione lyase family enzyme
MPLESRVTQTDLSLETIVLFVSDMVASRSFYEHTLGLRALAVNPHVAMYSAGHVQLCLLPAGEHGVALQDGPDRSADITFMVDDFPRCRDVLAARGVQFSRTLEYSIGVTADFYDPDGHWFSLYQPSEAAKGWPSGPKLEALASGLPVRHFSRVPPVDDATLGDDLADAFVAYVFLFFSDPDVAAGFYGGVLGLEVIEGGPCRRVPTRAPVGVVKYDVGTTMLTTHHVESDDKRMRVATVGTGGVAMAFRVADLTTGVGDLSRRGIAFSGWPSESPIGRLARFMDPAGHVLLLREPPQEGEGSIHAGVSASAVAEN